VSASTATATTVTAEAISSAGEVPREAAAPYVGRFAPSPTGALHLGSLVAALGSYLDARHHGGRWLLRMEDLDTPRVVPGCADQILRALECFGLLWDGEVTYQSHHIERYAASLDELRAKHLTFECSCSRRLRTSGPGDEQGYPGTCRDKAPRPSPPTATRFRIDEHQSLVVDDRFQGKCEFEMRAMGDVVVRRRDGVFAYQLAVVVDDADQGINYVVRGADLLTSTAWQISLQNALGLPQPSYAHLPLIVEPDGQKLSKSHRSVPVDPSRAGSLLLAALRLLGQTTPATAGIEFETPAVILKWGVDHWSPHAFHGIRATPARGT
jgi:glutamyl-Q tRNA(Asp) synthetase